MKPSESPRAPTSPADLVAKAVRLLQDRAEQILNAIDDGVYCLDANGDAIFVNEAGARMLGYGPRELLGKPQHDLIHHHYADGSPFPREECPIHLAVTDGIQHRVGGDVFWKKGGERLLVDYTAIPIKEGRQIAGAVVTFRDVTAEQSAEEQTRRLERERVARAQAEEARAALERSERRYRALVEASGQYIWTNTPDGRMAGDQPGWAALTGQTQAEYEGLGWSTAVHPDDAQPTIDEWNRAVAERRMFSFEHRVRRADGSYGLYAIRAVPVLDSDGEISEWVGVHTDMAGDPSSPDGVQRLRNERRRRTDAAS